MFHQVSYIRDCGEEIGRSLDALRKATTLQQILPLPLLEAPSSSTDSAGDDDYDSNDNEGGVVRGGGSTRAAESNTTGMPRARQQVPPPVQIKPSVFCAHVQDVYAKAATVLWRSFPRLLSVEVWQLCDAPSQPRPLLSLR